MPQSLSQTVRTQFNKGLLTEYSELNFPQEASIDELNCSVHKAGNRTRRLAVEYEPSNVLSDETYAEGTLFHTVDWRNVGLQPDVEFLVVQAGKDLRFYRKGSEPLSGSIVPISNSNSDPYILDLSEYNRQGGIGAETSKVEGTSINGRLIIVSSQIEPFYIERDADTGAFTVTRINFKVRDFKWIGEKDEYGTGDFSPSVERQYDTYNAGWDPEYYGTDNQSALENFLRENNSNGEWPPLTHPWFAGKNEDGEFRYGEWRKIYGGTSIIANGHYILDLFDKRRTIASGIPGIPNETTNERFSTVAAYAGRVWYAGVDSNIYYSQILENINNIGDCYQVNDPTSEYFSDLLPTDGGYIRIPEAYNIKKLHVFGASILVFADNGIWRISGRDGNIFDNADFSVYKISDFGLAYRGSFLAGQNAVPFWWSYTGIHTLEVTETGGFREVNLSRDTIQSFWDSIGTEERGFVSASYDGINNHLIWMYPETGETIDFKLNKFLILDVDLGAFVPWTVGDLNDDTPYITGATFFNGSGSEDVAFEVIDLNGNVVTDVNGETVIVTRTVGNLLSSSIYLLVRDSSGSLTFARFSGTSFQDWGGAPYDSYLESGYSFISDLGRRKNSPYITTFMRQTETGFNLSEGSYVATRESSLRVSAFWDFRKTSASLPQEAYRHKMPVYADEDDLSVFHTPTTVLTTRLKLLGRGRSVKLRFESSEGKDFNLLGWETLDATNSGY